MKILPLPLALVLLAVAVPSLAQDDHLQCYKIKDPVKLKGIVDLDSPQLGLDEGCKIRQAKYFCVPATKTVEEVKDRGTPFDPLPFGAEPAPGDRICYTVSCPKEELPDQLVTDQFGSRTLEKLKAKLVCTPAVKGSEYCGDGIVTGDEECEAGDLGGVSCEDIGYGAGGTLGCTTSCRFDPSGCSRIQACGPKTEYDSGTETCVSTCGDGEIDPGEDCDVGDLGGATCTTLGLIDGVLACGLGCSFDSSACETCGNGVVDDPSEECDDGNQTPGDGCDECLIEPPCTGSGGDVDSDGVCGDDDNCPGVFNPGQEGPPSGLGYACSKTVFVTSTISTGSFGGLAGGDAECAARASAAGLPGTYLPWLSDDVDSPSTRFVQSTVPYVRTDGVEVSASYFFLRQHNLSAPIGLDETGQPGSRFAWTGTLRNGQSVHPETCGAWTIGSGGVGQVGRSDSTNSDWSDGFDSDCSFEAALYCFEQ